MPEFYRCPRCGRDNSIKPLLDQPCDTPVSPPGETA